MPEQVKVILKEEGEPSGLAMMMLQYFEQNICEFDYKRKEAAALMGKLTLEAAEGQVGITVYFKGGKIEIFDGCHPNADMFVRGGIFDITELATGGSGGTVGKLLSGKLKIKSAWRHPFFAFRVARFMSLPAEMKTDAAAAKRSFKWKLAAGAAAAAILGTAAYFLAK
jgi:hypothetical protein